LKKKVLSVLVTIGIILAVSVTCVYAGNIDFHKHLPLQIDTTVVDYKTKTTNQRGSWIELNTAVSGYNTVTVWTDVKWANTGTVVKFTPRTTISTSSSSSVWLGGYTQYIPIVGDKMRLRAQAGGWAGDEITGNWDYC
jgi:hypothetical protein